MADIKKALQEGLVKFSFTKSDGSTRTAYGTLYPTVVSGLPHTKKYIPATSGNITYYDLEKDNWRSFVESRFQNIHAQARLDTSATLDELKTDYKALLGELPSGTATKIRTAKKAAKASGVKTILDTLRERFPKPEISDGGYFVTDKVWNAILTNIYTKMNTLMVGPAGTGKTELVRYACDKMGIPYHHYNIGTMTDVQASLIGSHTIDGEGHSKFSLARFVADIQEPGVVMLDELNRNPQALNVLTNVLDGIRELNISGTGEGDAMTVKVHPACIFFATANFGASYTGTSMLDEALETRFDFIGVDYIPEKEEGELLVARTGCDGDDGNLIARIARQIRDLFEKDELSKCISTRETLRIAQKMAIGNTLIDAFESILQRFEGSDSDGERGIVYKIIYGS